MKVIALWLTVFGMMVVLAGCEKPAEPQYNPAPAPYYLPSEEDDAYLPPPPQPQPQPQPDSSTPGPKNTSGTYTVQKGDTLYKIAREQLGDQTRVKEILALNPEITNPDVIKIGQVIRLPK